MELVGVEMKVGKETKDVIDLLCKLVADLKAKKDPASMLGDLLPALALALEGVSQIPAEAKAALPAEVSYLGMQLAAVLLA